MINWGIVGAGNIAHRFMNSLKNNGECHLYAISGRNREKLEAFAALYPCDRIYLSHDELLADKNIDAVYVALPNKLHFEYSLKALKNGKPVLCEKPAMMNVEQLERIREAAHENGVPFMEAMKSRFVPLYGKLKEEVEKGIIGQPVSLDTSLLFYRPDGTPDPNPEDGGVIYGCGIYNISMYEDFFKGEIRVRNSDVGWQNGVNMHVRAELEICGRTGILETGFGYRSDSVATLYGTEGYIVIPVFHRAQEAYICRHDEPVRKLAVPYEVDDFYSETAHFIELIRQGRIESDIMPIDASIRCLKIIDSITDGFQRQGG